MDNDNRKAMQCRTGGSVVVDNGKPVKKKALKKKADKPKPETDEKESTDVN